MSSPRTADVDTESPGDGESNIAGLSSSKTQTSAISATTESHVDNSGRVTLAPTSEGRRHSESTATEAHISRSPLNVTNGHTTNSRPVPSSPAPQLGDNHHPSSSSLKQKGLHSEVNSPNKKPLESQLSSMAPRFQASPASNGTAGSTKLDKEIARLNEVLAQTSAEAAQRILRQHWRIFLFDQYNEDHISFILRAGLKNSNFSIIERVFKDEASFKDSLISVISKKRSIIANVLKSATYGEVLDLMSESVLDRALSERLKHVPAKELIRWLAEADRLGYSLDDILDEEDESVLPNVPSRPQTSDEDAEMTDGIDSRPHVDLALPYRDTLLAEQERNAAALRLQSLPGPVVAPQLPPHVSAPLACLHCHQNFNDYSGYNYVSLLYPTFSTTPDHNPSI
jgi:hypothetical protein